MLFCAHQTVTYCRGLKRHTVCVPLHWTLMTFRNDHNPSWPVKTLMRQALGADLNAHLTMMFIVLMATDKPAVYITGLNGSSTFMFQPAGQTATLSSHLNAGVTYPDQYHTVFICLGQRKTGSPTEPGFS